MSVQEAEPRRREALGARRWPLWSAPLVLAAGFLTRPYITDFTDDAAVAEALRGAELRWLVAAVLMALGAALLALALPDAVRRLGDDRRARWVSVAATLGAVGLALQVGLMGLGAVAANRIGADVTAYIDTLRDLEMAVLSAGLVVLLAAWVGLARAAAETDLPTGTTRVIVVGAALGALGHLWPASGGEYLAAAGTAAALWTVDAATAGRRQ